MSRTAARIVLAPEERATLDAWARGRSLSHRKVVRAKIITMAAAEVDAPRGKVRLDSYHNVIHPTYIRRVEKRAGALQNSVIATYPNVGQFWKWTPEAYLAMPSYIEMKGKWVK